MKRKNKRKRRTMSLAEGVYAACFCFTLFIIGFYQSIKIIEEWYFRPDYIVDSADSLFSGILFLGLALLMALIAACTANGTPGERYATLLFLFFIAMGPVWSVSLYVLQYVTIEHYKSPQFGVCISKGGHGATYMYVRNSRWCQHFGYTIIRPSPDERGSN